jgi:uncharacterized protein involved in exopolysaccharide biosynthesis
MTIGDALRRSWLLVLLAVLLFGALGAGAGSSREPTYTANARLAVGGLNLTVQSVPGFALGGRVLAEGYARSISDPAVVDPVAKRLGLSVADVRRRLSATPVPETPIFSITATGDSEEQAISVANATARALVDYARDQGQDQRRAADLLKEYRQNALRLGRARDRLERLRELGASSESIVRARADMEELDLRASIVEELYQEARRERSQAAIVDVVSPADSAGSDRTSQMRLYGFAGVLAGLCFGMGLAVLRAWRVQRNADR